ncbi:hypothetical protein OIU76_004321 [Salix suchowensis]|nr:hypothetical protein OIU76_004321 [Salix suchowensis]
MGAPFATVAAFNAVLFTVRGQMEGLLRSQPGAPLTVNQQVVAGAGAGVAVSFLACPTELIKCRLQAQSALASSDSAVVAVKYGGPDGCDQACSQIRRRRGYFSAGKGLFDSGWWLSWGFLLGRSWLLKVSKACTKVLALPWLEVSLQMQHASWHTRFIEVKHCSDNKMEAARHSHSSMPLVSRLDHLDFAMKYLEGKQHLPKWRGNCSVGGAGRQSMTMDLAVKEAYLKGSLMDRVACLEHRLFQLCLELDSSSTSATSSRTSGYASSGQGLPTFTLATFNNPKSRRVPRQC